jgi:hypothetical protein
MHAVSLHLHVHLLLLLLHPQQQQLQVSNGLHSRQCFLLTAMDLACFPGDNTEQQLQLHAFQETWGAINRTIKVSAAAGVSNGVRCYC